MLLLELNANQYIRISDWEKENSNNERVMDGQEIELGMQIPYVPLCEAICPVLEMEWCLNH